MLKLLALVHACLALRRAARGGRKDYTDKAASESEGDSSDDEEFNVEFEVCRLVGWLVRSFIRSVFACGRISWAVHGVVKKTQTARPQSSKRAHHPPFCSPFCSCACLYVDTIILLQQRYLFFVVRSRSCRLFLISFLSVLISFDLRLR